MGNKLCTYNEERRLDQGDVNLAKDILEREHVEYASPSVKTPGAVRYSVDMEAQCDNSVFSPLQAS